MKLTVFSLAVNVLMASAAAQGFAGLPTCAQNCATNAIPKACGLDVKCICSAQSFIASITCCVADACNEVDQRATIKFADGICSGVGVTSLPQTAVCSSTATGSQPSTVSRSTATSTSAEASTTSATVNFSASSSFSPASQTSSSSASAASPSNTSAAAPITQTQNGGVVAAVGAAAVFVAMLLA